MDDNDYPETLQEKKPRYLTENVAINSFPRKKILKSSYFLLAYCQRRCYNERHT
jgi:hypothetical protein